MQIHPLYALIAIIMILIVITLCVEAQFTPVSTLTSDVVLEVNNETLRQNALAAFVDSDKNVHGSGVLGMYNMSVRKTESGFSGVVRGSSADGCIGISSPILFSYSYHILLNNNADIIETNLIDLDYKTFVHCEGAFASNGIEDSKIFMFKGEEWVIANMLGSPIQQYPCSNMMCIFKVKDPRKTFLPLNPPNGISTKKIQKNWGAFEYKGELYCEYSINPHGILKVNMKNGETTQITDELDNNMASNTSLRGGACPIKTLYNNEHVFLNIGHTKEVNLGLICDYRHFFYIFEANPPFRILGISDTFKIDTTNRIQFAAGISEYNNNIYVSFGVGDCYNRISIFAKDRVMSMIRDIPII